MGLAIRATALRKAYERGLVKALDGVDLAVGEGEHVAIVGPTGCGKSTLLALLALLDEPDSGELVLGGASARDIRPAERWRAKHVGIVFQFHHLLPHLTAEENVALPLAGHGLRRRPIREQAREVLERIGLGYRADALAATLSGGERQLTAVARALVARPSLVLADEPTGSVDSATGVRLLDTLFAACERDGATLVLVTHDPVVAGRAHRTIEMCDGRVVVASAAAPASLG